MYTARLAAQLAAELAEELVAERVAELVTELATRIDLHVGDLGVEAHLQHLILVAGLHLLLPQGGEALLGLGLDILERVENPAPLRLVGADGRLRLGGPVLLRGPSLLLNFLGWDDAKECKTSALSQTTQTTQPVPDITDDNL